MIQILCGFNFAFFSCRWIILKLGSFYAEKILFKHLSRIDSAASPLIHLARVQCDFNSSVPSVKAHFAAFDDARRLVVAKSQAFPTKSLNVIALGASPVIGQRFPDVHVASIVQRLKTNGDATSKEK